MRVRPHREAPPPIFGLLADSWQLSPAMATGLWAAIRAATWSRAVSWRQQLLLFQAQQAQLPPAASRRLMYTAAGAAETMHLVDDLYHEGRLTRREATQVQDAILRWVGPTGQWGSHAGTPAPAWSIDLAAVIEQYWR